MKVIGLTGGTGSGKGFVSTYLKTLGGLIIDADYIAHQIILKGEPAYNEIIEFFGLGILDFDGNIIRRRLGEIVFSDKIKLNRLNQITHKYISLRVNEIIKNAPCDKYKFIVYDAPLLFETDYKSICDEVWVVFAPYEVRLKRIIERDNISRKEAKNRIASQKSWEYYRSKGDKIIDNTKDDTYIKNQIDKLVFNLMEI